VKLGVVLEHTPFGTHGDTAILVALMCILGSGSQDVMMPLDRGMVTPCRMTSQLLRPIKSARNSGNHVLADRSTYVMSWDYFAFFILDNLFISAYKINGTINLST
jgi:hypothetical protein